MNRKELLGLLSSDISNYVLGGTIPDDDLAMVIKPDELDERFAEYDRLVDLHYLVEEDVITFVRRLQDRLRTIKTETHRQSRTSRGEIRGRINWSETHQQRANKSPGNTALYVTEHREEHADIPENIVLKAVLQQLKSAISDAREYLSQSHDWAAPWMADDELLDTFERLVQQNIHLRQIRDLKPYEPTDRMLQVAVQARGQLYRDAADLYQKRAAYDEGNEDAITGLLQRTAITPDDVDRLFELLVLFRVIEALEDEAVPGVGSLELQTLKKGRKAAAVADGPLDISVYFDRSGDADMKFKFVKEEGVSPSRGERVHLEAVEVADQFFEGGVENHSGRPDVVIKADGAGRARQKYFIVEVKHSTRKDTIQRGIKETIEYLAFLRESIGGDERGYAFDSPEVFDPGVNGLLVIDDLDGDGTLSYSEQANLPIRIIQISDLNAVLPSMLKQCFSEAV